MRYENRIVLFLDICGFKDHINKTVDKNGRDNEDEIKKIYNALQSIIRYREIDNGIKRFATQFSDSLVISFISEEKNQFLYLLSEIANLIFELIEYRIICRGAISYGKLIHTEDIIFGPAFIDAYLTESKAAMYPRVILDSNLLDKVEGTTEYYKDGRTQKDVLLSYLAKDEDDKYYIDYFEQCYSTMSLNRLNSYIDNLRAIIVTGLKNTKPDLEVKYGWMKNKFNKMVDEFTTDKFISYFGAGNGQTEIMKLKNLRRI